MCNCIKCGDEYNPKRRALGYRTCLSCGSPKLDLPIIPVNKSNYVVGTLSDLKNSYGHKGTTHHSF